MHSSMRQILTMLLVMLSATGVNANVVYQVIDLDTLSGEFNYYSVAHAINNKGEIVGESYKVNLSAPQHTSRATLFDPTDSVNNIDLGTLGGEFSCAYSINYFGQIVGHAKNELGDYHATLFDPTGAGNNIDLGTLGGNNSSAYSTNYFGQIVGRATNALGDRTATLFDPTGAGNNIDLGTLGGGRSVAYSINDLGQIVGAAQNESGYYRATIFDPTGSGNNIDLGTLGGSYSYAHSINNLGQIVGSAQKALGGFRATIFDPTGSGNNIDLGTLGGGRSSARSINNLGQIVGYANNALVYRTAILFDPTGAGNNIDLNTLIDSASGLTLSFAQCINNHGWIVGRIPHEGNAYLLIPEPPIGVEVDINPDMLNLNSKGKWITCYIWLPEEYNVADVNSHSVVLEDEIEAAWIWADEQTQVVMVKFRRSDVQEMLTESGGSGEVELTVRGELIDGTTFEGMDIIRVIDKGKK